MKGRDVIKEMVKQGWTLKRCTGSHNVLAKDGMPNQIISCRENEEVGHKMVSRIFKRARMVYA